MKKIGIISPCYNESDTIILFLQELESILTTCLFDFEVIVVDDGSFDDTLEKLLLFKTKSLNINLTILSLNYNVGHQEAIYQGLLYASTTDSEHFIVIDADGEDDPEAIPQLLNLTLYDIVYVTRGKREEQFLFRFLYYCYKMIFKFITKKNMNFGNYSMINKKILLHIKETSFIHYAAFLSKQRVKTTEICYDRKKRLKGKSKMNIFNLIHHGIKSLIEFAEELLMMFLKLFILLIFLLISSICYVLYLKIFTKEAILGWASNLSIGLFNAVLISLGFFIIGILLLNLVKQNSKTINQKRYKKIN